MYSEGQQTPNIPLLFVAWPDGADMVPETRFKATP